MVAKLPRKTAEYTQSALVRLFQPLPLHLRKSDTLDNGCEFTRHREITREIGLKIYFAKPYHSWERWGNENANGMIRRYFPKGTNFDDISEVEIQRVVDLINNRPRKILGYKTARQVFEQYL
jgi:IS30 family transposase